MQTKNPSSIHLVLFVFVVGLSFVGVLSNIQWTTGCIETPQAVDCLLVDAQDLPDGWAVRSRRADKAHGEISFYKFGQRYTPGVALFQEVTIFDTTQEAEAAYSNYTDELTYKSAPFVYTLEATHSDQQMLYCFDIRANGLDSELCQFVARYGNVLIKIGGNVFENKHLSHDELNSVIMRADTRIFSAFNPPIPTPTTIMYPLPTPLSLQ